MNIQHVQQPPPARRFCGLHLLQVVRNPRDPAMRLLVTRIVPVLVRRRSPAAVHVHSGEQHAAPPARHRPCDERGFIHLLHRRRPGQIARQHVVIGSRLRVDIHVVRHPPFRLVIQAPQADAARRGRPVGAHGVPHPLARKLRRHRHIRVVRVIHDLLPVQQDAVAAIGIVRCHGLLFAVLRHAETTGPRRARSPVHQGNGAQAHRARTQVGLVKPIETGAYRVVLIHPRVVAGVVFDARLPVITGGVIAAPARQGDPHGPLQAAVCPRIDAVNPRVDGVPPGLHIHFELRYGLATKREREAETGGKPCLTKHFLYNYPNFSSPNPLRRYYNF